MQKEVAHTLSKGQEFKYLEDHEIEVSAVIVARKPGINIL